MKKKLTPLLAGLVLMPAAGHLLADQPAVSAPQEQQATAPSYLGVGVGPVPQAVQAQLPENITHNQGLMVMRVMPGSPAEQSGLQQHDVLLSANGQTLITPDDLIKAVNKTAPGDKISLEILRHGKVQKLDATLAAKKVRQPPRIAPNRPPMSGPHSRMPARPALPDSGTHTQVWESFQAMTVNKQPDGSYQASVAFLDDKGNKQQFEFQGSRDEIVEQIKKEPKLPESQKQQLLNALQDDNTGFPGDMFPAFPDMEQLERDFFQPPPWARPYRRGFWD
ncbi:S1C family serine protease [Thiolapillus sp.]